MSDSTTPLHYTPNGNLVNGQYAPGADGFNLADISSASELRELPSGVKALVWLGMTGGVTASFQAAVKSFAGDSQVYGFYLADEPSPSAVTAANLKAESDWIHANYPGAKTFIVEENASGNLTPQYYYTPANTDADLFGLDPYPVQTNVPNDYDLNIIPLAVQAAKSIGIPQKDLVPVYQAFGGGSYTTYTVPTAAQEQQILSEWGSVLPNPAFDYAYSWGAQDGDSALSGDPALQQVFAAHNKGGVGTGGSAPAAPTLGDSSVQGGLVNAAHDTAAQTLSGTAGAGDTIKVYLNRSTTPSYSTVANASGGWSVKIGALANGAYSYAATATATDPAGNTSAFSAALKFTVDTVAPAAPTLGDSSVQGGLVNAAHDTAAQTLSGTAGAGDTIKVYLNRSTTPSYSTVANASGGWSVKIGALANGAYSYAATATDPAGNTSAFSAALKFTVDPQATGQPSTPLHYTPNGNLVNGQYAPGADGFNLADISSASELRELPSGVKALVWLGMTGGVTASFQAAVKSFAGDSQVYGFYLADEPSPSAVTAANLKAESDWIHANYPGAKTFIVEENASGNLTPQYYYTPANTDADLFGLDPYPVQTNVPNDYDLNIIPLAVQAAESIGIPQKDLVPVYQAFGGGSYTTYTVPTAAQEQQILSEWGSVLPNPAFDYAYSWGAQDGDSALSGDPALQQVFAAHNTAAPAAGSSATPAAAAQRNVALAGHSSVTSPSGDPAAGGDRSTLFTFESTWCADAISNLASQMCYFGSDKLAPPNAEINSAVGLSTSDQNMGSNLALSASEHLLSALNVTAADELKAGSAFHW